MEEQLFPSLHYAIAFTLSSSVLAPIVVENQDTRGSIKAANSTSRAFSFEKAASP